MTKTVILVASCTSDDCLLKAQKQCQTRYQGKWTRENYEGFVIFGAIKGWSNLDFNQ